MNMIVPSTGLLAIISFEHSPWNNLLQIVALTRLLRVSDAQSENMFHVLSVAFGLYTHRICLFARMLVSCSPAFVKHDFFDLCIDSLIHFGGWVWDGVALFCGEPADTSPSPTTQYKQPCSAFLFVLESAALVSQ